MYWISVFLVFFRNFFFNINPQLLFCFTNFTASQEKRESQRAGPVVRSSCFHYSWIPTGLLLIKESGFWLKPYMIFFRPDHRGLQRLSLEDRWREAALLHGTWPSQCTLASEGSRSQGLGTPSWQWQGSDASLHFQPRQPSFRGFFLRGLKQISFPQAPVCRPPSAERRQTMQTLFSTLTQYSAPFLF